MPSTIHTERPDRGRVLYPAIALLGVVGLAASLALVFGQSRDPQITQFAGPWFFPRPIEASGQSSAASQQALLLRTAVQSSLGRPAAEVADLLEAFANENPTSVWTPSLRANLAVYYYNEACYTKALQHWQAAWEATKSEPTGAAKRVADFALAHWARALVGLGRTDELGVLFAETQGRALDAGPLQQRFIQTREMHGILARRPAEAYRCGWRVLNQMANAVRGQGLDPRTEAALYREQNLFGKHGVKLA